MHSLFLVYLSVSTCFGRLCDHHQEKQLCLCDTSTLHTRQSSTLHTRQPSIQNNKYQVSHKHSCFSWWWAHSRLKHVEIDKFTKSKLYTRLALFTRLYRDARSTEHKIVQVRYLLVMVSGCCVQCVVVSRWKLRVRKWRAVNIPPPVYKYKQFLQFEVLGY